MNPFSKPQTDNQANQPNLAFQGEALEPEIKNQTSTEKPRRKLPLAKMLVAGIIILITLLAFGLIAYLVMNKDKAQAINSYEECVSAGYPIMESYPEQCAVPDGQTFTRELTEVEQKKLDPTADWETYSNSVYGISLKYPSEFQLKDTLPEKYTSEPSLNRYIQLTDNKGREFQFLPQVDGFGPIFNHKAYELKYSSENGFIVENEKSVEPNKNQDKDKIQIISFTRVEDGLGFYTYFNLKHNKDDENAEDVFKQILSTFKFTNVDASSDSNAISENVFDINNIKIGDSVGKFTVTNIRTANNFGSVAEDNFQITFQGQIALTGDYSILDDSTPGIRLNEVRFTPDDKSTELLPQEIHIMNYGYTESFRFNNYNSAYNLLNEYGKKGTKEIIIDNYTLVGLPAEVSFTADLIQID